MTPRDLAAPEASRAVDRVLPRRGRGAGHEPHSCVAVTGATPTCEAVPGITRLRWSTPRLCGANAKHTLYSGTYGHPVERAVCEMHRAAYARAVERNAVIALLERWGWL